MSVGPHLGSGASGATHRGTWRGGDVAVKRVRVRSDADAASFLREVEILSGLRHPNVFTFVGAALVPPDACYLISECCSGGTLARWLHGDASAPRAPRRSLASRLRMALGVARGMVAFEQAAPFPILHRDLKPSNVFVDGGGAPRVADAGLARFLAPGDAATLTGETGTYAYMAPEVFRHELYGPRADVYSYGVLLVELLSSTRPYADALLTPAQIATEVAAGKLRPAIPADAPPGVAALAAACLDAEPGLRPPFASVVPALARALAELPPEASTPAGSGGALLKGLWGSGRA